MHRNKLWDVQSLSFKPVPVEEKIEAVSKVVSGKKVQPVAREIGVDRTPI